MKTQFIAAAFLSCVTTFQAQASLSPKIPSEVKASVLTKKIDLNKANLSSLIGSFKGIGKKRAEAIISYRESHSGFKSIEELADVKGFGQHFVTANQEKLREVFIIN